MTCKQCEGLGETRELGFPVICRECGGSGTKYMPPPPPHVIPIDPDEWGVEL